MHKLASVGEKLAFKTAVSVHSLTFRVKYATKLSYFLENHSLHLILLNEFKFPFGILPTTTFRNTPSTAESIKIP